MTGPRFYERDEMIFHLYIVGPLTQAEIGRWYKMSRARVGQICDRVAKKYRKIGYEIRKQEATL